MKRLLLSLILLATVSLHASEIEFSGAAWDNLAIPLGITPYYVKIDSSVKSKAVALEMDLYVKGEFKRTIVSGVQSTDKEILLDFKSAIYFEQEGGKIRGTVTTAWGAGQSTSAFNLSQEEFPLTKGNASSSAAGKISASKRVPLFTIIAGGNRFTSSSDPEATAKANPESSVIVGYLKYE